MNIGKCCRKIWRCIHISDAFGEVKNLIGVVKYGFTDQSHLLREFKRYHTMDLSSAKRYAAKDVENIQYVSEILS